jgi:hypothetical protein
MAAAALGPEINTEIMKTKGNTEDNTIYFTRKPAQNRYCSHMGVFTQMQDNSNLR